VAAALGPDGGRVCGSGQGLPKGERAFCFGSTYGPGAGKAFIEYAKKYGVALGENVIVDKVSRMVGGRFFDALVSQYLVTHPVTKAMKQATFFPLVRTVQPSTDVVPGSM